VWRKGKMSVKQILFEESDGSYRLKNHKADKGKPVMRRQTWMQSSDGQALRRHEYRLFSRATILKPESDGSLSRNEGASLQAFPVIVHYFCKAGTVAGAPRTQRARKKRDREEDDEDDDDEDDEEAEAPAAPLAAQGQKEESAEQPQQQSVFLLGEEGLEDWFGGGAKRLKGDSSWVDDAVGGILAFDDRSALRESSMGLLRNSFGDAVAAIMMTPDTTVSVEACVPDYGHRPVQVLAIVPGFRAPTAAYEYGCTFSDTDVPARMIADGVVSFVSPQRQPGVVNFWVWRKNTATHQVDYTKHLPFFFLPSPHGDGHLSLAWNHLRAIPNEWCEKFGCYTKRLVVSNNFLDNLEFAALFPLLEELEADNNLVNGASFPHLPRLKHLSLNRNSIRDLDALVVALKKSCPNLLYLSLLGNEACPIFSTDKSAYGRYLQRVMAALPLLKTLDSTSVERKK
jgi:hypothetical protein